MEAEVRNIAAWNALLPTGWRIGGWLSGQAQLAGSLRAPTARGEIAVDDLSLRNVIEGVDIKRRQRTRGASRVTPSRSRASPRSPVRARCGPRARDRWRRLRDHRHGVDATLRRDQSRRPLGVIERRRTAERDRQEVALTGKITVDRGRIDITRLDTPKLSDDVVVIRKSRPPAAPAARSAPPNLNLVVDLGDDFRGRGLETFLRGQLTFTSPQGVLNATGNIRTRAAPTARMRSAC